MGLENNRGQWIVIGVITTVMILFFVIISDIGGEESNRSNFTLTAISFSPSGTFILTVSEPEITDPIRNELNRSKFTLMFEIENASINWTQDYIYDYWKGNDVFMMDRDNIMMSPMTEWEYNRVYRYQIRFLCDSDNETVRSLSLFDERYYVGGSFKITRSYGDKVELFDEDRPFFEYHGRTWIVYYGDVPEPGYIDDDTFLIEIDVRGRRHVDD